MIRRLLLLLSLFLFFAFANFASADVVGDQRQFFIDSDYDFFEQDTVTATLKKVSDKGYFYVSDEYFNSLGCYHGCRQIECINLLNELADEFDTVIYPTETAFWGSEPNPGIDNDPKITVLFVRLIDEAGGYFDTGNQYPLARIQASNEREIIYINVDSLFSGKAKMFLAHEFQHLITFNQKDILQKVADDIWLNELRSEYTVNLMGYDSPFENSNLKRRAIAYLQDPSDPLAEWKNKNSDYGAITIFGHYLVDNYGEDVLKDSLKSASSGIASLDEALKSNGFSKTFSDIFTDWAITSFINDTSVDDRFSYKNKDLSELKVNPTQNYSAVSNLLVSISKTVKDWQPNWYEFSLGSGNLKIDFSSSIGSNFKVPYITFKTDNTKTINLLNILNNRGMAIIGDFGTEVSKIVVIPSNQSKFSKFSSDEPVSSFSLKVSSKVDIDEFAVSPIISLPQTLTQELPDGALIKIRDSNTFYVLRDKWIRNIPTVDVLDFYGHLLSEEAIEVDSEIFNNYMVSNYVRGANDDKIYAIWSDNTKHWLNMSGSYFKESGRSFDAVYIINKAELDFYKTGAEIIN